MHYVCFHYEFEHDPADPDEECYAGGCPSSAVHPRPERRPSNAIVLGEVNAWFATRGLGLAASPTGGPAGQQLAWVDLISGGGQVLSSGYASGATLADAAAKARRRWEAEQSPRRT
jgi:hypothetical protein